MYIIFSQFSCDLMVIFFSSDKQANSDEGAGVVKDHDECSLLS